MAINRAVVASIKAATQSCRCCAAASHWLDLLACAASPVSHPGPTAGGPSSKCQAIAARTTISRIRSSSLSAND